jgi:hypothetical protein
MRQATGFTRNFASVVNDGLIPLVTALCWVAVCIMAATIWLALRFAHREG